MMNYNVGGAKPRVNLDDNVGGAEPCKFLDDAVEPRINLHCLASHELSVFSTNYKLSFGERHKLAKTVVETRKSGRTLFSPS